MAKVDFSSYAKQDVDVPFVVGKGSSRFEFHYPYKKGEKLLIRRWETYPYGPSDYISGIYLVTGGLVVVLPSACQKRVTLDFVSYSGGDMKVRGFNTDGKQIGYFFLPSRADASVRRASLELPGVKLLYFDQKQEVSIVSIYVDENPNRKLVDVREIVESLATVTPEGYQRVRAKRARVTRPSAPSRTRKAPR